MVRLKLDRIFKINRGRAITRPYLVALMTALLGFSHAACTEKIRKPMPLAKDGVIDLTGWDFDKDGPVDLKGQWRFAWKEFVQPAAVETLWSKYPGAIHVPANWVNEINPNKPDESLPTVGFGSYLLQIKLAPQATKRLDQFGFWYLAGTASSAQILTAGATKVLGTMVQGRPAESSAQEIPHLSIRVKQIDRFEANSLLIVIHVSNYQDARGGFWLMPEFGLEQDIYKQKSTKLYTSLVVIGVLIIVCLYHMIIYMQRPRDKSPLAFSLFCGIISMRESIIMGMGTFLGVSIDPDGYKLLKTFEYLALPLAVLATAFYIKSMVPGRVFNLLYSWWIVPTCTILAAFTVLVEPFTFTSYLHVYHVQMVSSVIVAVAHLCYQSFHKNKYRRSARLVGLSLLVLVSGTLYDIWNVVMDVHVHQYSTYTFMGFILMQSGIISGKFAKAFANVKHLVAKLKEQEKARTLFFHNTSHELRTPLNGIIGFLDLVRKKRYGDLSSQAVDQIGKAQHLAESLKTQINTILDLAKSKRGELKPHVHKLSLEEVKNEADDLAEGLKLSHPDLSYHSELTADDSAFIGDQEKIFTIIRNLLGNAFKFRDLSRPNHVSLNLISEFNQLKIIVADTGIGIPKKSRDQIFEEFAQVEADARRSYEGTGLGLSMVSNLVRLLDGSIDCQSEEGKGAVFTVMIPQQPETAIMIRVSHDSSEPISEFALELDGESIKSDEVKDIDIKTSDQRVFNLFVIDDSEINCEVISEILKIDGYNINYALSGRMGLKKMNLNKPDLLLLDMMMPEMSGEDVLQEMKNDPVLSNVPVILITARASEEDRILGLNLGADDYLPKPIMADELRLRVYNMMDRHRLLREQEQHRHSKNLLVQNEKLVQMGQLVASVGHEIANPIQLSKNSSAALDKKIQKLNNFIEPLLTQEDEETRIFAARLNACMDEIDKINQHHRIAIEKISDISSSLRTHSRREDTPTPDVDLNEVVKDSMVLVGGRTKLFEMCCEFGEIKPVVCYRSRIGQVMTNLLANAADALMEQVEERKAQDGSIFQGKIVVTSQLFDREGKSGVLLSVADNGNGVNEAIRNKIFDEFYTTKEAGKGTGLGLSLCLQIVAQHQGELRVTTDQELGGARFELWLPLEIADLRVA